jgi:hypothetical protein
MGATVIEGKHRPMVIDDEQRTASTANNDHTRDLEGAHAGASPLDVGFYVALVMVGALLGWTGRYRASRPL